FVTYLPGEDFLPEATSAGEGTGLRFVANFGGVRNDEAYLHFFFPTAGASLDSPAALRRSVEEALAGQDDVQRTERRSEAPPRCPWADDERLFTRTGTGQTLLGHVCFGTHGGRPFYLMVQFPEAYEEGFVPRAN